MRGVEASSATSERGAEDRVADRSDAEAAPEEAREARVAAEDGVAVEVAVSRAVELAHHDRGIRTRVDYTRRSPTQKRSFNADRKHVASSLHRICTRCTSPLQCSLRPIADNRDERSMQTPSYAGSTFGLLTQPRGCDGTGTRTARVHAQFEARDRGHMRDLSCQVSVYGDVQRTM
jgi:hypothetical protein